MFAQLNKLPIANVNKRIMDYKGQIERDIDEIENTIKLFSSKKPMYISDQNY